jgi:hypothetical protein
MGAAEIAIALKGRRSRSGWVCLCPAHDDHRPGLNVSERERRVLVKCWSGCPQDAVVAALKARKLWECGSGFGADEGAAQRDQASNLQRDPMKSWRNGSPRVRDTAADHYLRSRKIILTDEEAQSFRFHPALWHWPTQSKWPAMVARVSLASGEDLTVRAVSASQLDRQVSVLSARVFC